MFYNSMRRHRNNLRRQLGDNSLSDNYQQAKDELFDELLRQRELAELKKEIIKEITNNIDFTANVDKTLDEILKKFFGGK